MTGLGDFSPAPNIAADPATYEIENGALDRPGILWEAMRTAAPWGGRVLLDLGCGTGFWLPRYAADRHPPVALIGVEPDPELLGPARHRDGGAIVLRGSAEHLPLADGSVDVVHARFAYFWGAGSEAGLIEVRRVLRPGGALVVVDNDHLAGDFAELLAASGEPFALRSQDEVDAWWAAAGATREAVLSSWQFDSRADLEAVLALEFPADRAGPWLGAHPGALRLSYGFLLYTLRS